MSVPAPMPSTAPAAPAFLNRRAPIIGAAMSQGLGVAAHPRISTRMNRFSLVNAAGQVTLLPVLFLDVIIVGANNNVSKVFYEMEFDQSSTDYAPPDCFSDNGVGPSDRASRPQALLCSTCPMNVWGSDTSRVSGKPTKACNDVKKLAVICQMDAANTVYELRISPATLKHLRAYAEFLAKQSLGDRAVDAGDVITRLQFDPVTQGVLNFSAVGWIDDRIFAAMEQIEAAGVAKNIVGLNDKPRSTALPLLAAPAQPIAAAAPPAQVMPPPPAPPPAAPGVMFTPPPAATPPAAAPAAAPQAPPAAGTPPAAAAPAAPRRRGRPAAAAPAAPPAAAPPPVAPGAPPPSASMFTAAAPVAGPGMAQPAAYPAPNPDPNQLEVPAFLQRQQPAPGAPPAPPAAPAAAPPTTFGVGTAPPPGSPELDAALKAAFAVAAPPA